MIRLIAAFFVAILALPVLAQSDPRLPVVDAVVASYLGDDAPGIAVLVMQNGRVIHMQGYGKADLATGRTVTADSLFDLASVSKQMTALAVMLQLREGLYALDTPVGAILPAFAGQLDQKRPVTVRDLLHHVGGLADYLDGQMDYRAETTNAEVVDWLGQQPLVHRPGTVFDYSNSGFLTLGLLVAVADGADSLAEVLERRIWGPLGMQTVYLVGPVDTKETVTGYAGTGGEFTVSHDPTVTEGDGNVFISLRDLARYDAAFTTDVLLSAKDRGHLFMPGYYDNGTSISDEDGEGYGFGWFLGTYDGELNATHGGSWSGTATYYQRNLTTGVTVIVLANGEELWATALAEDVEAALR